MPLYPPTHAASLLPAIGGLLAKAVPFISGLFGRQAAAPAVSALAPVARQIVRPLARPLATIARVALPSLAVGAGVTAGQELVQRGFRITINRRTGEQRLVKVRRMNPTNVRAARRAVRRLRSFKRVTRKVNSLLMPRRVFVRARSGRPRRGDILPFEHDGSINPFAAEDYADWHDELEDLGYDPESFFPGDNEAEAGG